MARKAKHIEEEPSPIEESGPSIPEEVAESPAFPEEVMALLPQQGIGAGAVRSVEDIGRMYRVRLHDGGKLVCWKRGA